MVKIYLSAVFFIFGALSELFCIYIISPNERMIICRIICPKIRGKQPIRGLQY